MVGACDYQGAQTETPIVEALTHLTVCVGMPALQKCHQRTPKRAHISSRIRAAPSTESHLVNLARHSCFTPAHRPW